MHETRLGGLDIRIVDDKILFSPAGNPDNVLRVDNQFRQQLISFLGSYQTKKREQRTGFRVPLNDELFEGLESKLEGQVWLGSVLIPCRQKDISLSGLGFELQSAIPEGLERNGRVTLKLKFGAALMVVPGIVRRLETALMGISFENSVPETEFDPPDELIRIIRLLETQWLRRTRNVA